MKPTMETDTPYPGADESTPSRAQYFSWINNTNEGSTEEQTLVNLEFFAWLQREYGMTLDIYAWDAGNIDGSKCYGSMDSERFKERYPRGFGPIAERAAEMGTRLGVWGGPDGFGDTPEEEQARTGMMVSLCRDFNFMLFKIDGVCGQLREEKRDAFAHMMTECRKYSPDLILLNHRLELGHAVGHSTTWLWEGAETYIDIFMVNKQTAPHHRAGALSRGVPPDLQRLTEDHGVCLSSCLDYWEDDLILQAFNRCLILAPEIYGNPWLLRDDEFPKLARIYNLHRHYRDILVKGIILPEDRYGPFAVSRGNGQTRFVTMRNLTWEPVTYSAALDESIGLQAAGDLHVRRFHPTERILGIFPFGTAIDIEVPAFRSYLLAVSAEPFDEPGIEDCDYEVVRNVPGRPAEVRRLDTPIDAIRPCRLGELEQIPVPRDADALYEATCFGADNDALEVRELRRSGPTAIPEVEAARRAFFEQEFFWRRGIWDKYMFDDNPETFFGAWYRNDTDLRIDGGALRVDMGGPVTVDTIVIEHLSAEATGAYDGLRAQVSPDLISWHDITFHTDSSAPVDSVDVARIERNGSGVSYSKYAVETLTAEANTPGPVRYFRCPNAPDRVAEFRATTGGKAVDRTGWRGSNLFGTLAATPPVAAWRGTFPLGEETAGAYICVAIEGEHGIEKAYAAARIGDRLIGAPDRAPSYKSNVWEANFRPCQANCTFYIPVTEDMHEQEIELTVLLLEGGSDAISPVAWLTVPPPRL